MTDRTQQPVEVDCARVIAELERYLAGTLPLSELLDIANHLEACLPCMHQLELRQASFVVLTRAPGALDA